MIEIKHSHIVLEGFTVDGLNGDANNPEHYKDKLVYAIGTQRKKGVEGIKIRKMLIKNAGGECVRLRYFARGNEVRDSTIEHCGVYDFKFGQGGKNGEGIYIGTAPEQLGDGKNPTSDPDVSTYNRIENNIITTYGGECVDIKEAATHNIIKDNTCSRQRDPDSGGFGVRGNDNVIEGNASQDNAGAGIRIGGDTDEDGINNTIRGNVISGNSGPGIKMLRTAQHVVCENVLRNNENTEQDAQFAQACE